MGDLDILQANNAKAARKIRSKPQATLKLKKALKKLQIPRTQGRGGFVTRGPSVEGVQLIPQVPISPGRAPAGTPILTGVGPSPGGILGGLATTALRAGLRTPGIRQAVERIAGRVTTLPRFTPGEIFKGAAIAAGTAATIEGVGQLAERFKGPAAGPLLGPAIPAGFSQQRSLAMAAPGAGRSIQTLPGVGGMLPPGTTIVKVWSTGTANFARLLDGRIAVQRKDGTIKTYRPQKHIVIPRNPRVGTLIRADKRLERLTKGLRKVVRSGKR